MGEFGDLGRPLVVGPSRKGFLTKPLAKELPASERRLADRGSVTAVVLAGTSFASMQSGR